jgi:hypothetical protein
MKKAFLLIIIFIFSICVTNAQTAIEPKWSDYCPSEYLNAKKAKFDKDQKYWYERRLQFYDALENCKNTQADNLSSCYTELKTKEDNKNEEWNAYVREYNEKLDKRYEALEEKLPEFNGTQSLMNMLNIPTYNPLYY